MPCGTSSPCGTILVAPDCIRWSSRCPVAPDFHPVVLPVAPNPRAIANSISLWHQIPSLDLPLPCGTTSPRWPLPTQSTSLQPCGTTSPRGTSSPCDTSLPCGTGFQPVDYHHRHSCGTGLHSVLSGAEVAWGWIVASDWIGGVGSSAVDGEEAGGRRELGACTRPPGAKRGMAWAVSG